MKEFFNSMWHKILGAVIFVVGIFALFSKLLSDRNSEKFKKKVKELNKERHIIEGKEKVLSDQRDEVKGELEVIEKETDRLESEKESNRVSVKEAKDRLKKFLEDTGNE